MSGGYAVASTAKSINRLQRSMTKSSAVLRQRLGSKQYIEKKPMKLTLKERIRNWLLKDNDECEPVYANDCDGPEIQSQGFRLNIYGASGGTIIETTKYDRKQDENRHSLHVITEDKDLGEELAKIITMESLR
jgi:hypothetical protein